MQAGSNIRMRDLFITLTAIAMVALLSITAEAATRISYQGRLTDTLGQPVGNSDYTVLFSLFADSSEGDGLWEETASVSTMNGLFTHYLGSVTPLPDSLFRVYDDLYLEISVAAELVGPRLRLASVPYARIADGLKVTDGQDSLIMMTLPDSHQFSIYGSGGVETIRLRGDTVGDDAVMLPDSSIGAPEILDEPGIAVNTRSYCLPRA